MGDMAGGLLEEAGVASEEEGVEDLGVEDLGEAVLGEAVFRAGAGVAEEEGQAEAGKPWNRSISTRSWTRSG